MKSATKVCVKCAFCNQTDEVTYKIIGSKTFIRSDDKKCYHSDCYLKLCEDKIAHAKQIRSKEKWLSNIESIPFMQEVFDINIERRLLDKEIGDFLKEMYETEFIPSYIFSILQSIYTGKYEKLDCAIPPQHIYDMWVRQRHNLEGIYQKNKAKGKNMELTGRIKYDLAILLSKYSSYKKWLDEQATIEATNKVNMEKKAKAIALRRAINPYMKNMEKKKEEFDAMKAIEDIWDD